MLLQSCGIEATYVFSYVYLSAFVGLGCPCIAFAWLLPSLVCLVLVGLGKYTFLKVSLLSEEPNVLWKQIHLVHVKGICSLADPFLFVQGNFSMSRAFLVSPRDFEFV